MLKSMTGYGRASRSRDIGSFEMEIHSVNRKHLEVVIHLPKGLSRFDVECRQWLYPLVSRGHVSIKINGHFENVSCHRVSLNLSLVRQLKEACDGAAETLKMDGQELLLAILPQRDEVVSIEEQLEDEESLRLLLKELFDEAVEKFLGMKRREGEALYVDIVHRLDKIRTEIKKIEKEALTATSKYREKLSLRLEEFFSGESEIEERILKEVALYAEKVDIAEEVTRFYAHLNSFKELLVSTESSIGKTLEFVLQELGREVNTIGNKSSNLDIAKSVIEIKSELDRIREQIQNVE